MSNFSANSTIADWQTMVIGAFFRIVIFLAPDHGERHEAHPAGLIGLFPFLEIHVRLFVADLVFGVRRPGTLRKMLFRLKPVLGWPAGNLPGGHRSLGQQLRTG
jgi:hypothetical protein